MADIENETIELDQIYPALTIEKVTDLLNDSKPELVEQLGSELQLDSLPKEIELFLRQVFINKNLNTHAALKARFIQNMALAEEFQYLTILEKNVSLDENQVIDFILQDSRTEHTIWVVLFEYFDRVAFTHFEKQLKNTEIPNDPPEALYIVSGRIERRIAKDFQSAMIKDSRIKVVYFVEYEDQNLNFNDDDWIIIEDLKIRGFNFSTIDTILNILKKEKGKGQYSVLAESPSGNRKIIWQGILFPKEFLKQRK